MKKYVKPELKKAEKNTFVFAVIKAHKGETVTCRQCSSCHACRG